MTFGIGVPRAERVYERDRGQFVTHLLRREARVPLARTARPVRFLSVRSAAGEPIDVRDVRGVQRAWRMPAVVYGAHPEKVRTHPGTGEGRLLLTAAAVPRRKAAL